jgi:hypothetical protein
MCRLSEVQIAGAIPRVDNELFAGFRKAGGLNAGAQGIAFVQFAMSFP